MVNDAPPIPPALWERVLAFLATGGNGQIVLHVHRGAVGALDVLERIRVHDDEGGDRIG